MTEKEIIKKGFNAGYQLAKHRPKLASQLNASFKNKEATYSKAFMAGTKEYAKELEKTKQPKSWRPRGVKPPDKDKDKGFAL